jgi:hypothetical protein
MSRLKPVDLSVQEEPKWTPYARGPQTDSNAYRVQYIDSLKETAVAVV